MFYFQLMEEKLFFCKCFSIGLSIGSRIFSLAGLEAIVCIDVLFREREKRLDIIYGEGWNGSLIPKTLRVSSRCHGFGWSSV